MKTFPLSLAQTEALAQRFPTPFHLYDEAAIRKNARALTAAFGVPARIEGPLRLRTGLSPTASADSISERCEMLLSPGTVTSPDRAGAAEKVIGRGCSSEAVKAGSVHGASEKMRPAFDSALALWQGAPRFAGNLSCAA